MIIAFVAVIFLLLAIFGGFLHPVLNTRLSRSVFGTLTVLLFSALSWVYVGSDEEGHLKRVMLGDSLPEGRIIAMDGEMGPQARTLKPGLHIIPFVRLLYDFETFPVEIVPEGKVGVLVAADGKPLPKGHFMGRGWSKITDMLDAEKFLTEGGEKGPQLTVIPPGAWRYNHYLFQMKIHNAVNIPAGTVGVVKSNVVERDDCPENGLRYADAGPDDNVTVPLVPKGCVGVWDEPIYPGKHYLNPLAYKVVYVPTTVQTWTYKGGYTKREIPLVVNEDGSIKQGKPVEIAVPVPENAADKAIVTTVEGWRIPLELRVVLQIKPENAPRSVASVGNLRDIEDRVATPTLRSIVRNITGSEKQKVFDLVQKRAVLEDKTENALGPEMDKVGVTLKEVRFGDPVLPPELLVARKRSQLAAALVSTFKQEYQAQITRQKSEKAKAEANEQKRLVKADYDVKVAKKKKSEKQLLGEAQKLYKLEVAKGDKAIASVYGQQAAKEIALTRMAVDAAQATPEIVKVPTISVLGSGTSLEAAAAVFGGSSNIAQFLSRSATTQATGKREQP